MAFEASQPSGPTADHEQDLAKELEDYRPRRAQRYSDVNVLLLSWEGGDEYFTQETVEVAEMFRTKFNYAVRRFDIPSADTHRLLNLHVAQFIEHFGGQDKLIIVYYGGHGGPSGPKDSACIWAALPSGGPEVDWSIIQPQFLGAGCDVVILLDCCHAGQAVRNRVSHTVEFLAATDKDQLTPTGKGKWPSFTRVLLDSMADMLDRSGTVTIPEIHRRMLDIRAGLVKQPFYVSMTPETSSSPIILTKWYPAGQNTSSLPTPMDSIDASATGVMNLRLRLFHPLDPKSTRSFLRWMTRDAPASIKDIELVDKILARANAVNDLGQSLIGGEVGEKENAVLLPFLSTKSQKQATKLLQELEGSFLASGQNALGDLEAVELITNIKQQTDSLASFLDDCISSLDTRSLRTLKKMASKAAQDLRHRIAMRLTLLTEEASPDQTRVDFDSQATPRQRLRMGHHSGDSVLVEYIYYEDIDEQVQERLSQQVAKISALHVEPKDPSFRTLPGLGYLHDSLYGPRFGFIFKVPNDKIGWKPSLLSGILGKVKVPLETRYRLAHDLCEALLQLHSIGWFHKNMKSDNVLIFSSNDQKSVNNRTEGRTEPVYDFERPYLIGFDCSRPEEAETRGTVDFDVDANIYRHPDRWGRPLRFTRQHDLYALGIVLMEIGMWRTLPSMDSAQKGFASVKDPERLRKFLLTSAMPRLAHATGSRYADAVRSCLDPGEWTNYENWEVHDSMRQKVLRPLKAAYEALAS